LGRFGIFPAQKMTVLNFERYSNKILWENIAEWYLQPIPGRRYVVCFNAIDSGVADPWGFMEYLRVKYFNQYLDFNSIKTDLVSVVAVE